MPGHAWESGPLVGLTGSLRTEGTPSRWRSLEGRRKHPGLAPPHTGPPLLPAAPARWGALCAPRWHRCASGAQHRRARSQLALDR